jgi:hypothetical protein
VAHQWNDITVEKIAYRIISCPSVVPPFSSPQERNHIVTALNFEFTSRNTALRTHTSYLSWRDCTYVWYILCCDLTADACDCGHCYPEFTRREQLTLAIFVKRLQINVSQTANLIGSWGLNAHQEPCLPQTFKILLKFYYFLIDEKKSVDYFSESYQVALKKFPHYFWRYYGRKII